MLDHMGFAVADSARSRAFYVSVLGPLGFEAVVDVTAQRSGGYEGTGFGTTGRPVFWIGSGEPPAGSLHVAFTAASRAAVDAFHAAALAAGARDNGAPGFRPQYHPHYYGALVFDPDGNNIEAVCHIEEA